MIHLKFKTKIFHILLLLSWSHQGLANDSVWNHRTLYSAAGTQIKIDFNIEVEEFSGCYKCNLDTRAKNLWVNIIDTDLTSNDQVRIIFLNKEYSSYRNPGEFYLQTIELDLEFAENGRFTGPLGSLTIYSSGYGGTFHYAQEIAIVINGEWLLDPISNTNNFSLKL